MFFPLASVSIEGIDKVKALRIYKTAAIALIVVGCLASIARAFLPTKTDLAIIFAGQWITNSEEVKALPDNVVKTMNKFMTDYIGDDDAAGK